MQLGWMISSIAIVAVASAIAAPARAWEKIGGTEVNRVTDRDEVVLRGDDKHRQIRLCVNRGPLGIHDLDLVYASGDRQDAQIRDVIRGGACTRAIDLRGQRRNVAKIVIHYDPIAWTGKKTLVNIYAR